MQLKAKSQTRTQAQEVGVIKPLFLIEGQKGASKVARAKRLVLLVKA